MTVGKNRNVLIRNGEIINNDRKFKADVYIESGKIKDIGPNLEFEGIHNTIDATGKILMPGGICAGDIIQLESEGNYCSKPSQGALVSIQSGNTTKIMPFLAKNDLLGQFHKASDVMKKQSQCDFCLQPILTRWDGDTNLEMSSLCQKGVNSFKIIISERSISKDQSIYEFFKRCSALESLAVIEMESALSSSDMPDSVYRVTNLANMANCPLQVQKLSENETADVIVASRRKGNVVYGDASLGEPFHSIANSSSPYGVRNVSREAYLGELVSNGYLHTVNVRKGYGGTGLTNGCYGSYNGGGDGCHDTDYDEMCSIWRRFVGTGRMDPCTFVSVTSSNAAKIYNLYPRKGRIDIGSDADVVVMDTISSSDTSSSHIQPSHVILDGEVVTNKEELEETQHEGRFLFAPCGAEFHYSRLRQRQQVCKPQKVDREPYRGPVIEPQKELTAEEKRRLMNPIVSNGDEVYGCEFTEKTPRRLSKKIVTPPSGRSSPLW